MSTLLLVLSADSQLSLQAQIRQKLIEAIELGSLPPGRKLPSSRELAEQLQVARNTVVLAFEQLIEEGYLRSRERSGIYVADRVRQRGVVHQERRSSGERTTSPFQAHLKLSAESSRDYARQSGWRQHPYPFLDGYFDGSLYPAHHWREAARQAASMREFQRGDGGHEEHDEAELVEQIRTRLLPRRGIQANSEEVLVTFSTRHALNLLLELFVDQSSTVAMEDPGSPDVRELLRRRAGTVLAQPVDVDGMVADARLAAAQLVHLTPSHQSPTAVTMSTARREQLLALANEHNQLLIEDDSEGEVNFLGHPHPALRSLDRDNRVIYLGALPRVLAPGVSLAFVVAAPEIIAAMRRIRRVLSGTPPLLHQLTAAQFISLGYYDLLLLRLHQVFRERWTALRDALNHYLPQSIATIPNEGGTVHWVDVPAELCAAHLVQEAARRGILVESVADYFATSDVSIDELTPHRNGIRMGITSISTDKIRDGVASFAALIHELRSGQLETLADCQGEQLKGEALRQAVAGTRLLSKTVYGHPLAIDLHADGSMQGRAGFADEDRDDGRWWVDGDRWYRQWSQWSYGEAVGFYTVIAGQRIKLFNSEGRLIDTLVLHRPEH